MCASSCKTNDHESWGACVRAQGQMIGYANSANGMDMTKLNLVESKPISLGVLLLSYEPVK